MKLSLREARVLKGMTQVRLAEELKITTKTLCGYEKNPERMSIEQAQRVARVLGVVFDGVTFVAEDDPTDSILGREPIEQGDQS